MCFDGFTSQGRHVVGCAQQLARVLGHPLTGTGHLLLGLLGDETSVANLVSAGVELDRRMVGAEITTRIGPRSAPSSTCPPFTARASDALGYFSAGESGRPHDWIGPEHLFFGLLADRGSTAAKALRGTGLDLDVTRCRVLPLLNGQGNALLNGQGRVAR